MVLTNGGLRVVKNCFWFLMVQLQADVSEKLLTKLNSDHVCFDKLANQIIVQNPHEVRIRSYIEKAFLPSCMLSWFNILLQIQIHVSPAVDNTRSVPKDYL